MNRNKEKRNRYTCKEKMVDALSPALLIGVIIGVSLLTRNKIRKELKKLKNDTKPN